MITVILVGALLTAMASSMAVISSSNLRNAGRDRVAGAAMGSAEAGVAEAIAYLRMTNTVTALACSPNCGATNPWGEDDAAVRKSLALPRRRHGQGPHRRGPGVQPARGLRRPWYTIKSDGVAGTGPGLRRLEQTVTVEPLPFPIGVYANKINLNGTPQTFQQSVFRRRVHHRPREDGPSAAADVDDGTPPPPHHQVHLLPATTPRATPGRGPQHPQGCRVQLRCTPTTRTSRGGPMWAAPAPGPPGATSSRTRPTLDQYGRQLTNDQLAALLAWWRRLQGQYYNGTTSITAPKPGGVPQRRPVLRPRARTSQHQHPERAGRLYVERRAARARPAPSSFVVNHSSVGSGQVKLNSNADLAGAIFVQRGDFEYNGTATFTGTLVANTISKWNGNATSQLTDCYLKNLPPGVMEVTTTHFREVDS